MSIALADSVGTFFLEAVETAVRHKQVEATQAATLYLVRLLTDFAHPDQSMEDAFERPLAFLLNEAFQATGAERFRKLRNLGDAALYLASFFGEHIENRGVDPGYVAGMGSTAYSGAAAMLGLTGRGAAPTTARTPDRAVRREPPARDNVFGELSRNFDQFVTVLTMVAESALAQQAHGERGVLKLYERWLRSGSETLACELGARGIVPQRGPGGVH